MSDFIERIHHLADLPFEYYEAPRGPIWHIGQTRPVLNNHQGSIYDLAGLTDTLRVEEKLGRMQLNAWPSASTFSSNTAGTRLVGVAHTKNFQTLQMLYTVETGTWHTLQGPTPVRDGAPPANAILGGFIGDEIFALHVLPRFAHLSPETLYFSQYDADGNFLASRPLMTASKRQRKSDYTPELVWVAQHTTERTIIYAWDLFWLIDRQGIRKLRPPDELPTAPSAILATEGKHVLLFCPDAIIYEASICELDLATWTCMFQPVETLLRKDSSSGRAWMPSCPEMIPLRDGWVLLNFHDGSGINRTACWLWQRTTNRAWPIPMKAFHGEDYLSFTYSPAPDDRLIASTDKKLLVSKPLTEIVDDLQKKTAQRRAKTLPPLSPAAPRWNQ